MAKCTECGLFVKDKALCYCTGKSLSAQDVAKDTQCLNYISIQYEDGEPLSLEQHWLIKLTELEFRK